jgi:hypothetical protein
MHGHRLAVRHVLRAQKMGRNWLATERPAKARGARVAGIVRELEGHEHGSCIVVDFGLERLRS